MKIKCFVTGATGLVGSYVVKSLAADGHEVVAFSRSDDGRWLDWILTEEEKTRVTRLKGDLLDANCVRRAIVDNNCEYVANIAGRMNRDSRRDPKGSIQLNIHAFQDLLEICKEEKVRKVVWASSSVVYGTKTDRAARYGEDMADCILTEKTPYCPGSLYSYTKEFLEGLSKYYREYHDLDTVALRVNLVYGPFISSSYTPFFSSLIDKPALGEGGAVPYGDSVMDWQYVGDMGDIFRAVLLSSKNNTPTYQTRGELRPVSDAIKIVENLMPGIHLSRQPGEIDTPWKFDCSLLEKEIGYYPTTTLEEGLRKSINTARRSRGLPEV